MVKVVDVKVAAERWARGMKATPHLPCPNCGLKTRAWWKSGICPRCKAKLPHPK